MDFLPQLAAFAQVVMIDVSLAGDNAITVGLAASGLAVAERRRAVMVGIAAATVLRIIFAVIAVQLLHIAGLVVAGGLLLIWVAWKMFKDIRHQIRRRHDQKNSPGLPDQYTPKKLSSAIIQIVIADVSMSLDNVLAVAGVARDHLVVLVLGLALSVAMMGIASTFIARFTNRYPAIGYAGLAIVFYTAILMIWTGVHSLVAPT